MHNRRHSITGGTPTDSPTSATNPMTNGTRHWESKNLHTHTQRQTQQEWIHTPCSAPCFSTSNCFWDCLFLLKSVYCEDMHNRRHSITGGTPTDSPTNATNTMTNGTRHWDLHTHRERERETNATGMDSYAMLCPWLLDEQLFLGLSFSS